MPHHVMEQARSAHVEKSNANHTELSRSVTVEPLPAAAKAEAGVVLDTEGRQTQTSLRLAQDGHV